MKKIECKGVGDNDGFFELEVKASPKERVVSWREIKEEDFQNGKSSIRL